jgi:hypothetical protein
VKKPWHILSLALTALACFIAQTINATPASIQYDGVYQMSQVKDGVLFYKYLRFYPDGLVIGVSSVGKPDAIQKWFSSERPGVAKGKYAIKTDHITFSLKSAAGLVDFHGMLVGDKIDLYAYSHINQSGRNEVYSFVRWSAE